jgi:hypothetical protein
VEFTTGERPQLILPYAWAGPPDERIVGGAMPAMNGEVAAARDHGITLLASGCRQFLH